MKFISYSLKTILFICIIFSGKLYSWEGAGNISGRIIDARNLQPLLGANILVDGTSYGAASDENGNFTVSNLPSGSYNLTIRYIGYKVTKRSNIIVNPNRSTVLDIRMDEELIEGETVEVRGSYFNESPDAIVSSLSMDFEEIRRSPGDLVDIQRVVQALPSVASGSDQLNELIVRGGNPGENLFLMDNIEIPNPNHFPVQGSGGGPINLLNSYMVNNIDFYAGAFPSRFGDKASSVMNISLRNGSFERFRGEFSMGMAGAGALVEGPIGNIGSYIFSARKSYLDWIIDAVGLTAVPNYYNTQAKLTFNINPIHTLFLNGVFGSDNINIEGGDEAGYGRGAENVDTESSQYIAGITLRSVWSDKLYSFATISAVQNDLFVEVYDQPGRDVFFTNNSKEKEYTFKTDFNYRLSKNLELSFGGSYKNVGFDYDVNNEADTLFIYDIANRDSIIGIDDIYPEYIVNRNVNSNKSAFYSQLTFDFLNSFRITGGVRYDYFDYTEFKSWSPRLGLSYFITPSTSLNIAYGKHYQSPAYTELSANDLNRNLDNKFTEQYVVGIEHLFRDDIKLTIEGYYKNYFDVPINRTLTTLDPLDYDDGTFLNLGKAESKGIELFLQKKIVESFSTIISYSYSESRAIDPRTKKYYDWDYDYRNVLTLMAGYKYKFEKHDWYRNLKNKWWFYTISWLPIMPSDEFEVSLKFRYQGGRPFTPPTYIPELKEWVVTEQAELNTERYPAYHRLDLRIDKRYAYENWSFVIFFDLVNVYNQENIWNYQYNDDGTIDNVFQFNTLPIAGVTIEF